MSNPANKMLVKGLPTAYNQPVAVNYRHRMLHLYALLKGKWEEDLKQGGESLCGQMSEEAA